MVFRFSWNVFPIFAVFSQSSCPFSQASERTSMLTIINPMAPINYLLLLLLMPLASSAQSDKLEIKDLVYAEADGRKLLLDIYKPSSSNNPYLIVWVHGGAWHSGSKESPPQSFVRSGYALASVDYRLSVEAKFPAPIHDIKAAIR